MTRKKNSMATRRYARRARRTMARALAAALRAEDLAAQRRGFHSVAALLQALRGPELRTSLWNLNRHQN